MRLILIYALLRCVLWTSCRPNNQLQKSTFWETLKACCVSLDSLEMHSLHTAISPVSFIVTLKLPINTIYVTLLKYWFHSTFFTLGKDTDWLRTYLLWSSQAHNSSSIKVHAGYFWSLSATFINICLIDQIWSVL